MTARELQEALAAMPPRMAQTLIFHCVEGRTPGECAELYGVGLPQWQILFFEAARALAGEAAALPDEARTSSAPRLVETLRGADPEPSALVFPLRELIREREEVQRLILEAERAAAHSPERRRNDWLRRVAMVAIIVVSILIWLRDRAPASAPPAELERGSPSRP